MEDHQKKVCEDITMQGERHAHISEREDPKIKVLLAWETVATF